MPHPLSTHEIGGVSGQSLTEVDLCSWPTLTSRGEPADGEKNNHEKLKCTISAFPVLPLRVGRADRTILVPRA